VLSHRSLAPLAVVTLMLACAPEEPPLARRYEVETYMRELQDEGVVRIAVPDAAPPLASVADGVPRGFVVDLGRTVARTLGVRAEVSAFDPDRLEGLVEVGAADIAFPVEGLTEEVVREQVVTDPYLVGHQRLLAAAGSDIRGVEDLDGKRVCAHVDPRTAIDLEALAPRSEVRAGAGLGACVRDLRRGRVDAITAQDFELVWARTEVAEQGGPAVALVGDDLNTVGYGARVAGRPGFPEFVRDVLEAMQADGRWEATYRRWIDLPVDEPPTLTLQDAASLWPTGVEP
jgi:ABC-type amino acid transport substrate-binding protein